MDWEDGVNNYWDAFESRTKASLKVIGKSFDRKNLQFNDEFKDDFLRITAMR